MSSRRRIVFDTDEVVRSLYFAATSGDVEQLKSLIHEGANVNSFIQDGSSRVNGFIIILRISLQVIERVWQKIYNLKLRLTSQYNLSFTGSSGARNFFLQNNCSFIRKL